MLRESRFFPCCIGLSTKHWTVWFILSVGWHVVFEGQAASSIASGTWKRNSRYGTKSESLVALQSFEALTMMYHTATFSPAKPRKTTEA
jgi:hypothetical protein